MAFLRKLVGSSESSTDTPAIISAETDAQPVIQLSPKSPTDIFNIIFYVAVFIAIGFPLWWMTTTTSRATLPFDKIDSFEGGFARRTHQSTSGSNIQNLPVTDASERWKAFWILPPTSAVDVVFTLVNPTPDKMNVNWNAEKLTRYLNPTLERLSGIADFKVSSQILRFIDGDLSGITKGDGGRKQISLTDAAKIINLVEGRLGSFASNNHVLNFIIYVPAPDQQPLDILDQNKEVIATNSFMTPRWGGVMVYSDKSLTISGSSSLDILSVQIDVKNVAEVFLTQLFSHLGLIDAETRATNIEFEKDLDHLILKRTEMNLEDSISTLKSLSRLLNQIGQIAIKDLVAENIYDAVRYIDSAKSHLKSGENLQALLDSRKAWEKSERAFYDPSLLEQLYFPDDQKFAIYVPLFLPVGLPVILSLREAVKWWKDRHGTKLHIN